MKKIITLSLVAATLLFTGCGEETKKAATDATTKAVESTKDAATQAVDAAKEAAEKAVDTAKKATTKVVEAAKEGVATTAATATNAISDTTKNVAGAALYVKCAGCHGVDGKTKALGKSVEIAGQSKDELITKINGYKAGTLNVSGMGNLMKGQVATMDETSIEAVAAYISTLK